jgi:predicted O-linked N-acetylglucosamine transferase (SPINDLY family)
LRAIDYYLADRHFLPAEEFGGQFTEKLVALPAVAPFLPEIDAPPINELPALANGYITFGSFNRASKLRPEVIALWSRLLRAVPDSRMVIGGMPPAGQYENILECFDRERIARERLEFHRRCGVDAYLALHHKVDICLDAFPYSGGTTTAHALWMGVPTLSLAGHTPAGRYGATILGHANLSQYLAIDASDFERKGLQAVADLGALARVRAGLRERFDQAPFSRPDTIAVGLERALRAMWQRWCDGLPPESFEVNVPGDAQGSANQVRAR